ncbi:hypothetical protein ACE10Z_24350 [Bradyrhizobium sp. Pha-3]|uniref:hypothetical protein n=1 Tax=Bradyrhizobium sp. Pha-3 TaxID=208375 RepID=UPI0035D4D7A9
MARLFALLFALLIFRREAIADDNELLGSMREWSAKPELPSLQAACASSLRYANGLADLSAKGATINAMLQWGVQEAARTAASAVGKTPDPDMIALGAMMRITKQIQVLRSSQSIYRLVRGGFPQWIYRSCLKDDPVD